MAAEGVPLGLDTQKLLLPALCPCVWGAGVCLPQGAIEFSIGEGPVAIVRVEAIKHRVELCASYTQRYRDR